MRHLHLAAPLSICEYLEFPHESRSGLTAATRDQVLAKPLGIDSAGYAQVPERMGLGFVLNEERIAHHTVHVMERGKVIGAG